MLQDLDRPGFFKDYFNSVRCTVSPDQLNAFNKLKTDEERVKFCYETIPAVHDIEIRHFFRGKSERDALDRKEAGNKEFSQKKNVEALRCYSQAVVKAPVLSGKYWKLIKENADPRKMTLYPICLANRSAALYQLNDYYLCVKDIDEALEHHYPKELKWKLYKRKARILVDCKRHLDARDAFRQALKWLDWAHMERERRMDIQKEIQKWLSIFQTGRSVRNMGDFKTKGKVLPPLPSLAQGRNPMFPALSSKVEIKYSPTRGRYAVAKEDIAVGDYLCTEQPYAAVLLAEAFGTHCQNCFILVQAPIPCQTCSGVVFCSSECRDDAYFHKIECPLMNLLAASGMSINCFLAFRMLTQTPLTFFLEHKDRLRAEEDPESVLKEKPKVEPPKDCKENGEVVPIANGKPELTVSVNKDGVKPVQNGETNESKPVENGENADKPVDKPEKAFKDMTEEEKQKVIEEEEELRQKILAEKALEEEQEYEKVRREIAEARERKAAAARWKQEMFWRVYGLVRHSERRSVEDYFHRTVMAVFLLKSVKRTKYFDQVKPNGIGTKDKLSEAEQLAGGLLLRFLQTIQFNAHEVSQFCLPETNRLDGSKNLSLGAAIYPTLAYFNHSCHAAQIRYFSGNAVITRAVRTVRAGEVVPENYGQSYATRSRDQRRLYLTDRYWFSCDCESCEENWPSFDAQDPRRLKFRCQACGAPFPFSVDCPNPIHRCAGCGEPTNVLGAVKSLQDSEKSYQSAQEEMAAGNIGAAEALLQQNLSALLGALLPPYRDLHLAQEAYTKCCLWRGNRVVDRQRCGDPSPQEE